MRGRRGQTGHSLVDVLVAMAIMGLVMSATLSMLQSGLAAWGWGAGRVEAQQAIRAALERMARELREAGYDPTRCGDRGRPRRRARPVVFQRDLNGNGLIDPTRERVTYLLRPRETTLRRDAGGGAQPLAESVRRFTLSYLDKDGAPTADPARIASVRIEIEAGRAGPEATMATLVTLRNGPIW